MNLLKHLAIPIFCGLLNLTAAPYLSFEDTEDWKPLISGSSVPVTIVEEHVTHGKKSARLLFPGSEKDTWPGLYIKVTPQALAGRNMLTFTAWHEQDSTVYLSVRTDYEHRTSIFSSTRIPPKSKGTVMLPFSTIDSDDKPDYPQRILLYMRMPREDTTLWLDNLTFINGMDQFKKITFVPPEGQRTITPAEQSLGAQLFSRTWMEHVFPNVKPLPSDPPAALSAVACPGESEPMTLSVHALQDIAAASVSVEKPLVGPNGAVIPPSSFTLYNIRNLDKRVTYQSKSFYSQIPMVLDRAKVFPIAATTTHTFWVDLTIPETTAAGTYRGEAMLTLDGRTAAVPMTITVRSFKLPEVPTQFAGEYYTATSPSEPDKRLAQFEEDFAFMRKLGMTSIGLCMSITIKECTYENGKAVIRLLDNDPFVMAMNTYKKYGFPCPVILLSDNGYDFARKVETNESSPAFLAAHQAFWKAMQQECRRRGWAELIVQPVDEPGWQDKKAQDKNVMLLKSLKTIPGMRTEQDGPDDTYFYTIAGPLSDVWNFNGRVATPSKMRELAEQGKLVMLYNCDVESYRPVTSRYVAGFFQERSKANGVFNWAYRSYGNSPFNDFDSPLGDTTNYYPTTGAIVGGPGIGLVSFREGIDDFRYIALLKSLIAAHPGPQADKAQAVLDDILKSINYNKQIRDGASFKGLPMANGTARVTGVLNLRNGWQLASYDFARNAIAKQIEILLGTTTDTADGMDAFHASTQATTATATVKNSYRVSVPRCAQAPVIDGKLDDSSWKKAGKLANFQLNTGGAPLAQTTAYVMADETTLYLAAECQEEYMNAIQTTITKNQGPVYNDDCIEFFFDTDNKEEDYIQLVVNALGVYWLGTNGRTWQGAIRTAGARAGDRWFVEVAIPRASLKFAGPVFGFNVCRERRPLEVFELSCWSPTGASFGTPSCFGKATFAK